RLDRTAAGRARRVCGRTRRLAVGAAADTRRRSRRWSNVDAGPARRRARARSPRRSRTTDRSARGRAAREAERRQARPRSRPVDARALADRVETPTRARHGLSDEARTARDDRSRGAARGRSAESRDTFRAHPRGCTHRRSGYTPRAPAAPDALRALARSLARTRVRAAP